METISNHPDSEVSLKKEMDEDENLDGRTTEMCFPSKTGQCGNLSNENHLSVLFERQASHLCAGIKMKTLDSLQEALNQIPATKINSSKIRPQSVRQIRTPSRYLSDAEKWNKGSPLRSQRLISKTCKKTSNESTLITQTLEMVHSVPAAVHHVPETGRFVGVPKIINQKHETSTPFGQVPKPSILRQLLEPSKKSFQGEKIGSADARLYNAASVQSVAAPRGHAPLQINIGSIDPPSPLSPLPEEVKKEEGDVNTEAEAFALLQQRLQATASRRDILLRQLEEVEQLETQLGAELVNRFGKEAAGNDLKQANGAVVEGQNAAARIMANTERYGSHSFRVSGRMPEKIEVRKVVSKELGFVQKGQSSGGNGIEKASGPGNDFQSKRQHLANGSGTTDVDKMANCISTRSNSNLEAAALNWPLSSACNSNFNGKPTVTSTTTTNRLPDEMRRSLRTKRSDTSEETSSIFVGNHESATQVASFRSLQVVPEPNIVWIPNELITYLSVFQSISMQIPTNDSLGNLTNEGVNISVNDDIVISANDGVKILADDVTEILTNDTFILDQLLKNDSEQIPIVVNSIQGHSDEISKDNLIKSKSLHTNPSAPKRMHDCYTCKSKFKLKRCMKLHQAATGCLPRPNRRTSGLTEMLGTLENQPKSISDIKSSDDDLVKSKNLRKNPSARKPMYVCYTCKAEFKLKRCMKLHQATTGCLSKPNFWDSLHAEMRQTVGNQPKSISGAEVHSVESKKKEKRQTCDACGGERTGILACQACRKLIANVDQLIAEIEKLGGIETTLTGMLQLVQTGFKKHASKRKLEVPDKDRMKIEGEGNIIEMDEGNRDRFDTGGTVIGANVINGDEMELECETIVVSQDDETAAGEQAKLGEMALLPEATEEGLARVTSGNTKPFACAKCPWRFSDPRRLLEHLRRHTGYRPYMCFRCGKDFTGYGALRLHLQNHDRARPGLQCAYCPKQLSSKGLLEVHERTHTGERPYSCEHCDRTFASAWQVTLHTRVHTGERPFACTECEKRFTMTCHLTEHMKTHSGKKPYKCHECFSGFRTKTALDKHLLSHTDERPYECSKCNKHFKGRIALRQHMRGKRHKQRK